MSKIFPLTSGGRGPSTKKMFFQSKHVLSQIWCQKIFPLPGGRGWRGDPLTKKFFFQSEHVSSQIWCQNFFLLLVGGVPWQKNFFSSLNMYQAKSGVKNFSLYWGGGSFDKIFFLCVWTCIKPNLVSNCIPFTVGGVPGQKNFFPVWTCIKPNLVSKIFPFTGGGRVNQQKKMFSVWRYIKPNLMSKIVPFTRVGGPFTKIFFSSLNMYQAKSGVKIISLYRCGGRESQSTKKNVFSLKIYQAKSGVKNCSLYWGGVSLFKKFFFQSEHVSSEIRCRNFFLLLLGGIPWQKSFFPSLKIYQAKSGVKIFSLNHKGEVPQQKNFFFFPSEHVSSQIWCQKFFPLLGGVLSQKIFLSCLNMYQAKSGVKIFSLYWGGVSLYKKIFFQSEHVSNQIWCQKFFPLPVGGKGDGGGSLDKKIVFPVWTCIK